MIAAALLVLLPSIAERTFTWRVDPIVPRVGDRVVLEAVLEPTPRDQVAVTDPGSVLGLVEVGEFEVRRDGVKLLLTRAYVAGFSGAIDLPNPVVRSGDELWRARPARLDVLEVAPGRLGRELVDPLRPIALREPSALRVVVMSLALLCGIGFVLWRGRRRRRAGQRSRGAAVSLEFAADPDDEFLVRLDRITSAFATRAVPLHATTEALRDLLRDVLAARSGEPARARTSGEWDTLMRTKPVGDAQFCAAILDAVEEQCYGHVAAADAGRVEQWLDATRTWLRAARGGA